MSNVSLTTDLLGTIIETEGIPGLLHHAGVWFEKGETIDAAFAMVAAAERAHLILQGDNKAIIVTLDEGAGYTVYVDLGEYRFGIFGLHGNGYSVPSDSDRQLNALALWDVVKWIIDGVQEGMHVHPNKVHDYRRFRKAVHEALLDLERLFAHF